MITIREATDADTPRVIEMAMRFIFTTGYEHWLGEATPERVVDFLAIVKEHGAVFVAETEFPDVIGMLAVVVVPHPLTGRDYADEVAWWVDPPHRHSSAGPRLLHHLECWAVQKRLHMIRMLSPAGSTVGEFYSKCGYQATETAWVKALDGSDDSGRRPGRVPAG